MLSTEIICEALNETNKEFEEIDRDTCFLCGKEITKGVKVKKILSSNFTNFDICNNIQKEYICNECAYCIKNADLRKFNIIASKDNIYLLKKNDLEGYLFNLYRYIEGEFIVCITQSFKKHNVIRAKVNTNPNIFYIRQEADEYSFNATELKEVYKKLNEAYLYFSKEELETGDYKIISIEQFGLENFLEYEEVFKKYRGSSQFSLLIYIMNSERRNDIIKERLKKEKEEKAKLKKKKEKNNAK